MEEYVFGGVKIRVIDLEPTGAGFRVVEVYDVSGRMVYEFRTSAKGKRAAKIGYATALRYRYV